MGDTFYQREVDEVDCFATMLASGEFEAANDRCGTEYGSLVDAPVEG